MDKKCTKKPGEIREELGMANILEAPIICLSECKKVPSSISHKKFTPLNRSRHKINTCIGEVIESVILQYKKELKKRKKRRK